MRAERNKRERKRERRGSDTKRSCVGCREERNKAFDDLFLIKRKPLEMNDPCAYVSSIVVAIYPGWYVSSTSCWLSS